MSMINDNVIEKILCGDLNRENCDEENVHKFLCLLKDEQQRKKMTLKKFSRKSLEHL